MANIRVQNKVINVFLKESESVTIPVDEVWKVKIHSALGHVSININNNKIHNSGSVGLHEIGMIVKGGSIIKNAESQNVFINGFVIN